MPGFSILRVSKQSLLQAHRLLLVLEVFCTWYAAVLHVCDWTQFVPTKIVTYFERICSDMAGVFLDKFVLYIETALVEKASTYR